jgi:uncharacterized protein YycO
MQTIRVHFTKRPWNPVSWLIRHTLPRSILAAALSSHAIIDLCDGTAVEASMIHGVRRAPLADVLKGSEIVATREFGVPDRAAAVEWLQSQVGTRYDFAGAFGLLEPDRDWQREDAWFCYELAAAALTKAGLNLFNRLGSITERELLGINPEILTTFKAIPCVENHKPS